MLHFQSWSYSKRALFEQWVLQNLGLLAWFAGIDVKYSKYQQHSLELHHEATSTLSLKKKKWLVLGIKPMTVAGRDFWKTGVPLLHVGRHSRHHVKVWSFDGSPEIAESPRLTEFSYSPFSKRTAENPRTEMGFLWVVYSSKLLIINKEIIH